MIRLPTRRRRGRARASPPCSSRRRRPGTASRHGSAGARPCRCARRSSSSSITLVAALVAPEQVALRAHRQLPPLRDRAVGPKSASSSDASWQAVIPRAWSVRWASRIARLPVLRGRRRGTSRSTSRIAVSCSVPDGAPVVSRSITPPAGSGVAGVIPASSSARAVAPRRVAVPRLSSDRAVGDERIEELPRSASGRRSRPSTSRRRRSTRRAECEPRTRRSPPHAPPASSSRRGRTARAAIPPCAKWRWASWKPGRTVRPSSSITSIAGPISSRISRSEPTATIRPPATATASARGWAGSTVMTLPPRSASSTPVISIESTAALLPCIDTLGASGADRLPPQGVACGDVDAHRRRQQQPSGRRLVRAHRAVGGCPRGSTPGGRALLRARARVGSRRTAGSTTIRRLATQHTATSGSCWL